LGRHRPQAPPCWARWRARGTKHGRAVKAVRSQPEPGNEGLRLAAGLPAVSLGRSLDPAEVHVGRDVERRAVVSPITIGRFFARVDPAEMLAIGTEDIDPAGTGGE